MPYALCPMPYALCPREHLMLRSKGYTAYSRFMNYTPETGFLYSSRIITDSIARNPVSLCYTYMEYAVFSELAQIVER